MHQHEAQGVNGIHTLGYGSHTLAVPQCTTLAS